eukprot:TRINITY_DN11922_c0_g1_i1.p1 TRINITY_DN11922_c0_g1~~TRINITY_DN11922_c0_g1_i1.p1  ORF type:complete len:362 (-),score=24.04 TRINITY_DN11922_c0_g1_i1:105-1151(-)
MGFIFHFSILACMVDIAFATRPGIHRSVFDSAAGGVSHENSSVDANSADLNGSHGSSSVDSNGAAENASHEHSSTNSNSAALNASHEKSAVDSNSSAENASHEHSSVASNSSTENASHEQSSIGSNSAAVNASHEHSSVASNSSTENASHEQSSVDSTSAARNASHEHPSVASNSTALNASHENISGDVGSTEEDVFDEQDAEHEEEEEEDRGGGVPRHSKIRDFRVRRVRRSGTVPADTTTEDPDVVSCTDADKVETCNWVDSKGSDLVHTKENIDHCARRYIVKYGETFCCKVSKKDFGLMGCVPSFVSCEDAREDGGSRRHRIDLLLLLLMLAIYIGRGNLKPEP